jgi:hypothetical protein
MSSPSEPSSTPRAESSWSSPWSSTLRAPPQPRQQLPEQPAVAKAPRAPLAGRSATPPGQPRPLGRSPHVRANPYAGETQAELARKLMIALKHLVAAEELIDSKDEHIEALEAQLRQANQRLHGSGSTNRDGLPRLPTGYPGATVLTLARYA